MWVGNRTEIAKCHYLRDFHSVSLSETQAYPLLVLCCYLFSGRRFLQFLMCHIHFTHASLTCTGLLITVKDAGNYACKPTRLKKAYETIIHFTRHFARRSSILKLVIHHHNTRFMLFLSDQVRQRVLFSTPVPACRQPLHGRSHGGVATCNAFDVGCLTFDARGLR